MKRSLVLPILFILLMILCPVLAGCQESIPTAAPITIEKAYAPVEASVFYLDQKLSLEKPLYFVGGRLYLPMLEFANAVGAKLEMEQNEAVLSLGERRIVLVEDADDHSHSFFTKDDVLYLSLFDIAENFHLVVRFDSQKNSVYLYKAPENGILESADDQKNQKPAYLRLEDITSTDGKTGNLSNENLEKLRAMSDFLSQNRQEFYIAWIPYYVNPELGYDNDMTRNFTFYNADFLYTLDYMTHHGGRIVLHGLTHQENDTVSTIGTEFGENTPFTEDEIANRMQKSKAIAEYFGYNSNIFEFPHCIATPRQLKIAEQIFDVIYQQNYTTKKIGTIVYTKAGNGRTVQYVPTPLGYLETKADTQDMQQRIESNPAGTLASMFFHPYLDLEAISLDTTEDGIRSYTYQQTGILPQIVQKTKDCGYRFSSFDL